MPTRKQLAQQEAEERAAHRRVAQEAEDKKAELLRKAAEDERTAMAAEAAKATKCFKGLTLKHSCSIYQDLKLTMSY